MRFWVTCWFENPCLCKYFDTLHVWLTNLQNNPFFLFKHKVKYHRIEIYFTEYKMFLHLRRSSRISACLCFVSSRNSFPSPIFTCYQSVFCILYQVVSIMWSVFYSLTMYHIVSILYSDYNNNRLYFEFCIL